MLRSLFSEVITKAGRGFSVGRYGLWLVALGSIVLAGSARVTEAQEGICDRTQQVQDEIVELVDEVSDCADINATHLAGITELNLNFKSITSLKAGDFEGLTGLETLFLIFNQLSTLPAGIFSGLTSLEELFLDYNQLSTLPEGIFSGLTSLEELGLSNNEYSTLPAGIFNGLTSLQELVLQSDLSKNPLSVLPAGIFSGLENLEKLYLRYSQLSVLPEGIFSDLTSLQLLDLQFNRLSTLPAGIFNGLTSLEELDLHQNELSTLPAGIFSSLTSLRSLSLGSNPGAPFELMLELQRSGSTASSETNVPQDFVIRLAQSAPFDMKIALSATNASLSVNEVSLTAGSSVTEVFTLTPSGNGTPSLVLAPPSLPQDFNGITLAGGSFMPGSFPVFSTEVDDEVVGINRAITPINLPQAQGGVGSLVYTLQTQGGGLPPGLVYNPSTRTLSGTPTKEDIYPMTYRVTDSIGQSFILSFNLTISDINFASDTADQIYPRDKAIATLQLPATTDTGDTYSYTLVHEGGNSLASLGLSFDSTTRQLTGTPTLDGSYDMVYEVTRDSDGATGQQAFTIQVYSLGLSPNTVADQLYETGLPIAPLSVPSAAEGLGGVVSYTLVDAEGNLPAGLSFNAGVLSGTPTTAGDHVMTYKATDTRGAEASLSFAIKVASLSFAAVVQDKVWELDKAITTETLPAATGGTGITYTLTGASGGALPAGLRFDASTRELSGTPSASADVELIYQATDTAGVTKTVQFGVNIYKLKFASTVGHLSFQLNEALTALELPQATEGVGTVTYDLTGTLPAGLSFDAAKRELSGTPTTEVAEAELTYVATDSNGVTASQSITIRVDELGFAEGIQNQVYELNQPITAVTLPLSDSDSSGSFTYSLGDGDGNLPPGLIFTPGTRVLSGTPTVAGTTTVTYKAVDASDVEGTLPFSIKVAELSFASSVSNQVVETGREMTAVLLPEATDGTGEVTYKLTEAGGGALPAGLIFDKAKRELSGTPTQAGTYSLLYQAVDSEGVAGRQSFTLRVAALTLDSTITNQLFETNQPIASLQLPVASGGTGAITYQLTGALPAGLSFDRDSRRLTGTPTSKGDYELTYQARDSQGVTKTQDFTLVVNHLEFVLPEDVPTSLALNEAIASPINLPIARGKDNATPTYELTVEGYSLSQLGLSFNADPAARSLSGTASRRGNYKFVYQATGTGGVTGTLRFAVQVGSLSFASVQEDIDVAANQQFSEFLPAVTNGVGSVTYSLQPADGSALPAWLSFTASNRELAITLGSTKGTYEMVYKAVDSEGVSAEMKFVIRIDPYSFDDTVAAQNYNLNVSIGTLTLPSVVDSSGTGTFTYSLGLRNDETTLPEGLRFDADSLQLSGTPTQQGVYEMVYEVTDSEGASGALSFDITIGELNFGVGVSVDDMLFEQNQEINAVTLPQARSNGLAEISYTLTAADGGGLPEGLDFDPETRSLSGIPTAAVGDYEILYRAQVDTGLVVELGFTITVDVLESPTIEDISLELNQAMKAIVFPESPNTGRQLSYQLTGALPPGIEFDTDTRTLSGTPSQRGNFAMIYEVSDSEGHSATHAFAIKVSSVVDTKVHQRILHRVMLTLTDSTSRAIETRMKLRSGLRHSRAQVTGYFRPDTGDFQLPLSLGNQLDDDDGKIYVPNSLVVWGQPYSKTSMSENGDGFEWEGDLNNWQVGFDLLHNTIWGELVWGLMVTDSSGDFDFSLDELSEQDNTYSSNLQLYNPWIGLSYMDGSRETNVWGSAGLGNGDVEMDGDGFLKPQVNDVTMMMLLVGGSSTWRKNDWEVSLRGEGAWMDLELDGSDEGVPEMSLDMWRLRGALRGYLIISSGKEGTLSVSGEFGIRLENRGGEGADGEDLLAEGDEDSESGEEGGVGIDYVSHDGRLSMGYGFRMLTMDLFDYEEQGHQIHIHWKPFGDQGFGFRLGSSMGDPNSGLERLWSEENLRTLARHQGDVLEPDWDAELSYGLKRLNGLLTPYSVYGFGGNTQSLTLGSRFKLGSFTVKMESKQRYTPTKIFPPHLRLNINWRF